ncbi:carboxypeptidase-like regulatory domain-containing protein [Nocardioides sp. W7]|uniref:carboxypeptidase-like regulatory domain-containing protein n=1 Tax=Nocardioides sp. W7 TaxID=2931390 RepID=UPI001FD5B41F|nr:carboxypeptidase-like regulatory domain-containing protein [Nocardioides sp. W7]
MRVATENRVVMAEPGSTIDLVVDVVNTGDLIDGVTASLIGLPGATVDVEPKVLPLFPSAQGQIRLTVEVPATQPAGSHPVSVEVVSHGSGAVSQHVDIDLSVSARPAVRLGRTPHTVRGRRNGRFVLEVENTGNTALDASLDATVEDGRTTTRFTPRTLRVEPGVTTPVILVVKGPRMFTGAELDRTAAINLTAKRTNVISAMQEAENEPELEAATTVVLRQRPTISRGVLTALILMLIIGLWAAVFLLGLTQVLAGDPLTKTAPASFFPVSAEEAAAEADGAGSEGGSEGEAAGGGDAAAAAPAGAMPKDGLLPPGVGGTIEGVVTATSNELPVGRILVEAYRDGRKGPQLVSSAASQTDGTYSLVGLFPTSYRLKFSAKGFEPVWYPAKKNPARATQVPVSAQGKVAGINAVVSGLPAQIQGTIDQGSSLEPAEATVTARPLDMLTPEGLPVGVVAQTTTTNGAYTLTGLPAPATYELSFEFVGYAVKKVVTKVSGEEQRLQPSIVPSASAGTISGTVTDGRRKPLGGVTVSTTIAGETVSIVTPTVGVVGQYTLGDLPTPGTYVLTFTSEGHGSTSEVVELDAGQTRPGLNVRLIAGTGSITGHLYDLDGKGIGGATVTVGGASGMPAATGADAVTGSTPLVPTATTLTTGDVGSFSLSGLQAPGEYTLTFSLKGYAAQSVPVVLSESGPSNTLEVTLTTELGRLAGVVVDASGTPYVGATVSVTNGQQTWTATSGAAGTGDLPAGGYRVNGLPPGSYSATVTAPNMRQQTALVTIIAGVDTTQRLRVRRAD